MHTKSRARSVFINTLGFAVLSAEIENALPKAEHKMCLTTRQVLLFYQLNSKMPCKSRAQNVFNNTLGFAVLSAEFENALQKQSTKCV
jgi:hypothetical protein